LSTIYFSGEDFFGGYMTDTTLGLDLGPNSIGWALVDESAQQVIAAGVRVFLEGVERSGKKEQSKNKSRRDARSQRRQLARRSKRRRQIRESFLAIGFLPTEANQTKKLSESNGTAGCRA
jgi:CRISPR-associated endonuclease Csn1